LASAIKRRTQGIFENWVLRRIFEKKNKDEIIGDWKNAYRGS
jgi:hypothetical protein